MSILFCAVTSKRPNKRLSANSMTTQTLLDFDLSESSDDSDFRIEDHDDDSDDLSINTNDDRSGHDNDDTDDDDDDDDDDSDDENSDESDKNKLDSNDKKVCTRFEEFTLCVGCCCGADIRDSFIALHILLPVNFCSCLHGVVKAMTLCRQRMRQTRPLTGPRPRY